MLQQWMASNHPEAILSALQSTATGPTRRASGLLRAQAAAIDGATTAEARAALEACKDRAVEIVTGNAAVQVGGSSSSSCGLCHRRRRCCCCCCCICCLGVRSASTSDCGVKAALLQAGALCSLLLYMHIKRCRSHDPHRCGCRRRCGERRACRSCSCSWTRSTGRTCRRRR